MFACVRKLESAALECEGLTLSEHKVHTAAPPARSHEMCLLSPITFQARGSMPPGIDGFASRPHASVHMLACSHVKVREVGSVGSSVGLITEKTYESMKVLITRKLQNIRTFVPYSMRK